MQLSMLGSLKNLPRALNPTNAVLAGRDTRNVGLVEKELAPVPCVFGVPRQAYAAGTRKASRGGRTVRGSLVRRKRRQLTLEQIFQHRLAARLTITLRRFWPIDQRQAGAPADPAVAL